MNMGREWRWSAATALVVFAMLAINYSRAPTSGVYEVFSFRPLFADTVAILAAGQARHEGLNVYQAPNPIDPLGRPHVYGPWWLATGALGLRVEDAVWVGALLAGLFVVAAVAVLRPRSLVDALCALALLGSPPVMLGVTRGNNDLVVFLLLAAAAWLVGRAAWAAAFGCAAVTLAAILKMYPFAAFAALLLPGRRRNALLGTALSLLAGLTVLWFWRADYRQAMALAPNPHTTYAYGLPVSYSSWLAFGAIRFGYMVTWLLTVAAVLALFAREWRAVWQAVPGEGAGAFAFVAGGAAWSFCFLLIRSYPYRAVLLLLPAALWLAQRQHPAQGRAARWQFLLWALVLWLDAPRRFWGAQLEGNTDIHGPAWTRFEIIVAVEQALTVALTALLVVSCAGAMFRRFVSPRAVPAA
jgi:hypothetical protein